MLTAVRTKRLQRQIKTQECTHVSFNERQIESTHRLASIAVEDHLNSIRHRREARAFRLVPVHVTKLSSAA